MENVLWIFACCIPAILVVGGAIWGGIAFGKRIRANRAQTEESARAAQKKDEDDFWGGTPGGAPPAPPRPPQ